ncbi:MAG: hypothetical protein R3C11_08595 [Planctomycetaceae bacterium]
MEKESSQPELEQSVQEWGNAFKELIPQLPQPVSTTRSRVVFATTGVLFVTGGLLLEHQLDLYQVRSADGPLALRELDRDYVEMMLGSVNEQIEEKDKLFAFEVGTFKLGPRLAYQQFDYNIGDSLIAECYLSPPHSDMWLECNLHDDHDNLIDRVRLLVARDQNVVDFGYTFGEGIAPGKYDLVVFSKGEEIARKRITLNETREYRAAN